MIPQEPFDKSAAERSQAAGTSSSPAKAEADESGESADGKAQSSGVPVTTPLGAGPAKVSSQPGTSPAADSDVGAQAEVGSPDKASLLTSVKPALKAPAKLPLRPIADPNASASSALPPPARPGPPKVAADKSTAPPLPFKPEPTLPISMTARPDQPPAPNNTRLFPGELEGSFEAALLAVKASSRQESFSARILRFLGAKRPRRATDTNRTVAFDGFRTDLYDKKIERDRRYGTVYTVSEEINAFLVRLELPRQMPASSLKQTWQLPDEMPEYDYVLSLTDNVLTIRAGLRGEAWRRAAYVSPSLPSDFATRIDFEVAVQGFKHRLRDKVIEIIVYKRLGADPKRAA
jgi:hypothetical protein